MFFLKKKKENFKLEYLLSLFGLAAALDIFQKHFFKYDLQF